MTIPKEPTYMESAERLRRILERLNALAQQNDIPTKQPAEERAREDRAVRG